jgi:6-phosphogluconate dehydrogenase
MSTTRARGSKHMAKMMQSAIEHSDMQFIAETCHCQLKKNLCVGEQLPRFCEVLALFFDCLVDCE